MRRLTRRCLAHWDFFPPALARRGFGRPRLARLAPPLARLAPPLARLALAVPLAFAPMLLAARGAGAVERVVSLNLCTDQWLVLLAPEKVAALSTLARDPALSHVAARAASLPVTRASAEAVLALRPDLVLGASFGARTTLALLERAGIRVVRVPIPEDFPGIRSGLRDLAALLGVAERAETLIAAMDADLAAASALPLNTGPPNTTPLTAAPSTTSPIVTAPPTTAPIVTAPIVTALVWQPRGWTAGRDGLMDHVLRAAGLTNIGTGGRVGLEALLRHPPALLILPGSGGASLATEMLDHPAARGIPRRMVPTPLRICPGPYTAEAVAALLQSVPR